MEVINYILGYENLKIYQNTDMFNFSLDSVLLAHFVTINKNTKKILDIGTGNAIVPILLTTRTESLITGVEIQKQSYDLALKSININKLENQIEIINDDINILFNNIETEYYDTITCNPPYFKINENSHLNNTEYKTIARHEVKLNLDQIMKISKKILKNNGNISLVHRPERLIEIIEIMKKYNIEPKKIQLVYPGRQKESNILLIEGVKNGKPGLKILPPLYSHNEDGSYTDEIKKYFS